MRKKMHFNFCDILSPKEIEIYQSYHRGQISDLRDMAPLVEKKHLYDSERAFIFRLAKAINKDNKDIATSVADRILYEAWLWGQNVH